LIYYTVLAEGENGEDGNTYEEEFQDADDEEELSPVGEEVY